MSETDNKVDSRFDLDIWRSSAERIEMVLYDDCPLSVLEAVVEWDMDNEVIERVSGAVLCTDEMFTAIAKKIGISESELTARRTLYIADCKSNVSHAFCPVPWNHLSTNANGTIRMCCQMIHQSDEEDSPSLGTVYKEDGTVLTGRDDITEHRNAPAWKKLRRQFLSGERPALCKLCYDEEDNGIDSKRQWSNLSFPNVRRDAHMTGADGSIKHENFPIDHWDLRFGNKCNLACRSCGPTDSSLWYDDWVELTGNDTFHYQDTGDVKITIGENGKATVDDKAFNWYEDSKLWDHIIDTLDVATRFYFTGGEPTINIKHRQLLQVMIDKGVASRITLDYNTNMAGVPSKVFDLWKEFKAVHLGMSIDGIFEHFEYIRYPGKWDAAFRNMTRVDTEDRLQNVTASLTPTISIMNVLHILDMQWWMKEQDWQRINTNVVVHNLYGPPSLNIQNIPNSMKQYITKRYKQFFLDINRRWPDDRAFCHLTQQRFESILMHMNAVEMDPKHWKDYTRIGTKLDTIRGENIAVSLPEIKQLVDQYNDTESRRKTANKLEIPS